MHIYINTIYAVLHSGFFYKTDGRSKIFKEAGRRTGKGWKKSRGELLFY